MSSNYLKNSSRRGKSSRITISVESQIEEKISKISEMMSTCTGEDWSMSKVVNMLLLGGVLAPLRFGTYEWNIVKKFADGRNLNLTEFPVEEYAANLAALKQIV